MKAEAKKMKKEGGMKEWQEGLEVTQDGMREGWKAR